MGAVVISTKKGIEGIKLKSTNPPFIEEKNQNLLKRILQIINKNKKIKSKSINLKKYYLKKYSMKNILNEFIKKMRFKDLIRNSTVLSSPGYNFNIYITFINTYSFKSSRIRKLWKLYYFPFYINVFY